MNLYLPAAIPLTFFLIIISGVFSLFVSSLDLCKKTRLEKENKKSYKAVLEIIEDNRGLILACRLWIIILRVCAAFLAVLIFTQLLLKGAEINRTVVWILFAAFTLVFGIITALLGEAAAKLFARTAPEKIAVALLPAMKIFSYLMLPFTLPAAKCASFFYKVIRPEIDDSGITEEELQDELRNTLIEGEKSGVVESKERTMVEGVFYLGDRPVGAFMTHRSEIQWFDINDSYEEARVKALEYRQQQCFPVVKGSPDVIVGAVYLEDIILNYAPVPAQAETAPGVTLRAIMKKAQFVPETMPALKAFESFKQGQSNFLFVMDEYGGLAGIISVRALVEEIVGELSASASNENPLLQQEDGSWLADGSLNIDDAANGLGLTGLGEKGDFHTLAGFILHLAGELPKVGDSYEHHGFIFKVIDKDGNRIDKLLITKKPE